MNKKPEQKKSGIFRIILIGVILLVPFILSGCSSENENGSLSDRLSGMLGISSAGQIPENHGIIESTVSAPTGAEPIDETVSPLMPTAEPTPSIYTIQLWVPPQFDTEQDTRAGKALSAAIASYTQDHPNVNVMVRVKAVSGDSKMVNTIISANQVAKDNLPSLALLSRNDMETCVQRNVLQPIDSNIFVDGGTWYGYAKQSSVVDNNAYGIPVFGDGLVLAYRKSKIGAELGDWQDILGRGMPIAFTPSSSNSFFSSFIYLTMGGKLTNDQGQPFLDQAKLVDTLNFFLGGGQNGSFPPAIAQLTDQNQVWQKFNDGTYSMMVTPFSSYRHYMTEDIAVHSLPLQNNSVDYPLISTWNLVLLEDNPLLRNEALRFAEYLSDIAVNDELTMSAGFLPVRNGNHQSWQNDPEFGIVQYISENGSLVPNNSISSKVYPLINNAVTQIIKNQATPDDAARDAVVGL